jgi:NAD(P)-dependent dehydrogenase (short-subunit alcohol dehydrogenase family)
MDRLRDKNVVITGAASGIGAAVIGEAGRQGAKVFGLDIDDERGQAVAREQGAVFYQCDVSDTQSWESVVKKLSDSSEGIHHLHLNAGIQSAPPEADLQDYRFSAMTLARYRRLMGVNIDGVVLGLHYLLPMMEEGGSIVVTGSLAGVVPYEIDPLYSMTKHAVTGLVRSLRSELAECGLRINALCPGGIDTGIIPQQQRTDDAKFMSPEHVAEEVINLFLTEESGATWAKVSESKPAWIMYPPGRK